MRVCYRLVLIVLMVVLAACSAAPDGSPLPSQTDTLPPVPRATDLPTAAPAATPTPVEPSPTPDQEYLPCPAADAVQDILTPLHLLYTNGSQVYAWEETTGAPVEVPLPEEAVIPVISPQGNYIAYLQQGLTADRPEKPLTEMPLWIYERQSGKNRLLATFDPSAMRTLYPLAPWILLRAEWLNTESHLLVQIFPSAWGEGMPAPTGDLYLVEVLTGKVQPILRAGEYEYYALSPTGQQLAALDSSVFTTGGTWNFDAPQEGVLRLIDLIPEVRRNEIPLELTQNYWFYAAPMYAPDGKYVVVETTGGLTVVETASGTVQQATLVNPCAANDCYWGAGLPVNWLPDASGFFTRTAINDYFDERAESTLYLLERSSGWKPQEVARLAVNPWTFLFSPDRKILAFWNQPDPDRGVEMMNYVSLSLMDVQSGKALPYVAEYVLRVQSFSPDGIHFLYTYSPHGGPNPVYKRFAVGSVCRAPQPLPVPENRLISQTEWVDAGRFLALTVPDDGIPSQYVSGLYLYTLLQAGAPRWIDDLVRDIEDPYGSTPPQVVILRQ